jgi:hypothetical protein
VAHSWIGFPSGEVAPQSLRESFPVVVCPLVVDSLSEMVFTGPYAPPIRNRSDAPLPPPLAFLSLCRVRARSQTVAALLGTVIEAVWQPDRHPFLNQACPRL